MAEQNRRLLGVRNTGPQDFSFFTEDIPRFFENQVVPRLPRSPREAGQQLGGVIQVGAENIPSLIPPPVGLQGIGQKTDLLGAMRGTNEFLSGLSNPAGSQVSDFENQLLMRGIGPGTGLSPEEIFMEELRNQGPIQTPEVDAGAEASGQGFLGGIDPSRFLETQRQTFRQDIPELPQREPPPPIDVSQVREFLDQARPERVESFEPGIGQFLGAAAGGAQGAENVGDVLLGAGSGAARLTTQADRAANQQERQFQQQLSRFFQNRANTEFQIAQAEQQQEAQRRKIEFFNEQLQFQRNKPKIDVAGDGTITVTRTEDGEQVTEVIDRPTTDDFLDLMETQARAAEARAEIGGGTAEDALVDIPLSGNQEIPVPRQVQPHATIAAQLALGNIPFTREGQDQVDRIKDEFLINNFTDQEVPGNLQERKQAVRDALLTASNQGLDEDKARDMAERAAFQKIFRRMVNDPEFQRTVLQEAAPFLNPQGLGQ